MRSVVECGRERKRGVSEGLGYLATSTNLEIETRNIISTIQFAAREIC